MDARSETEHSEGKLGLLALGAIGVVYGDIGTSPLYTIKTAIDWAGGEVAPEDALGIFSLIVWTLVIITSIKYVGVIMRADNDGEGGILALMSLLGVKHGRKPLIVAIGMLGAALLFGDGAITPAISVLSALEGLKASAPAIGALCRAAFRRRAHRAVRRAVARDGMDLPALRPDHGAVVRRDRQSRRGCRVMRHPSVLWALDPRVGLSYCHRQRAFRLSRSRRSVSLRHGRGGALRRHGSFRPHAHPPRLVRPGLSRAAAELRRTDRAASSMRRSMPAPILSTIFVRNGGSWAWSSWRRLRPSSPARRSSPAPFR